MIEGNLPAPQIIDGAWANSNLETATLEIKKALCIGGGAAGYYPAVVIHLHDETQTRVPARDISRADLRTRLIEAQRALCHLAESVGIDPKQLTDDVHNGRG